MGFIRRSQRLCEVLEGLPYHEGSKGLYGGSTEALSHELWNTRWSRGIEYWAVTEVLRSLGFGVQGLGIRVCGFLTRPYMYHSEQVENLTRQHT